MDGKTSLFTEFVSYLVLFFFQLQREMEEKKAAAEKQAKQKKEKRIKYEWL
tara:strand:- start:174 stop:326 length:153 start_codon:yes stop_codon:yes gene_type:complete